MSQIKKVESKNKLYFRCVRSLTLLDLLNSADPANCIREESSANKDACLLQLMTATTTIENILVNLSAADKSALDSREQFTVQIRKDSEDSCNAGVLNNANSKLLWSVKQLQYRLMKLWETWRPNKLCTKMSSCH